MIKKGTIYPRKPNTSIIRFDVASFYNAFFLCLFVVFVVLYSPTVLLLAALTLNICAPIKITLNNIINFQDPNF